MSNIVLTVQYLQYDAHPRFTITLQVKSKRTLGSLEVKMDAITIGSYLVCTNAPQVKIWEENSWFMTWESQQLPSLESLHLRVPRAFLPLVLCNVCNRPTNLVAKASWWQTVPHATLNWPLNTICFMKLAIIVRASSASPRKRNGETC